MKLRILIMVLLSLFLLGCTTLRDQHEDPFVGKWIEYWPDIPQHATHNIAKHGNQYQIEGSSPLTERYRISNVRIEGDCLKFSEGTATFTVEYELRVKDTQTLSVRAKGRSGWRDDIVWRRTQ